MTFDRLRQLPREQITLDRLARGLWRRTVAIPHNIAYRLHAGPQSENHDRIRAYRDRHAGQQCFILGNGPSLANTDFDGLAGQIAFGMNRIFLLSDRRGFRPDYYVCMNGLVLEQSHGEIATLNMPRFVNWSHRNLFEGNEQIIYLRESFSPRFEEDLTRGIWVGATVTFVALQIAYYMGFEKVILIGVDHRYSRSGTPHTTVSGSATDPDHFDPAYFPPGFRWQLPDLKTSEIAYQMALEAYQADSREILDATMDGNLQVFPKVDYRSVI